jgi:hypothetical protein
MIGSSLSSPPPPLPYTRGSVSLGVPQASARLLLGGYGPQRQDRHALQGSTLRLNQSSLFDALGVTCLAPTLVSCVGGGGRPAADDHGPISRQVEEPSMPPPVTLCPATDEHGARCCQLSRVGQVVLAHEAFLGFWLGTFVAFCLTYPGTLPVARYADG